MHEKLNPHFDMVPKEDQQKFINKFLDDNPKMRFHSASKTQQAINSHTGKDVFEDICDIVVKQRKDHKVFIR